MNHKLAHVQGTQLKPTKALFWKLQLVVAAEAFFEVSITNLSKYVKLSA